MGAALILVRVYCVDDGECGSAGIRLVNRWDEGAFGDGLEHPEGVPRALSGNIGGREPSQASPAISAEM